MGPEEQVKQTPISLWKSLRRIFLYSRPYRLRLYIALALTVVASFVWLAVPMGLRELLDAVFQNENRVLLNLITLVLLALFLLQTVVGFGGRYLLEWVGERVVTELRKSLYDRLTMLGLRFFSNQRVGDLTSRLTNDVGSVRTAVTSALAELLTQSLSLVGSLFLMVMLNWRLSLFVFGLVPPVTLLARYFGLKIRELSRSIQDRLADTTAIAEEALSAVRIVKAFAREAYEITRYFTAVESLFETARRTIVVRLVFSSLMGLLFLGTLVSIFWFGGIEVLAGRLSTGDLVAFIFYAFYIARSVGGMSHLYATFNTAAGASERIFELLDAVPEIRDKKDAVSLPPLRGFVTFEHVSFCYEEDITVLNDLNFSVEPGETIALVGPSGAGKTTLLNLIPRFFDPQKGKIRIDGYDLKSVKKRSIREQVAVVPQDVHLFNGTIQDNIRYGRLEASDEEIEAAARAANAHDFILEMAQAYETEVGERGIKLSGGQRQRLAIARAILKGARILLLDEATSSLDSTSEAYVQEALERLMTGRTTFIIAHRLATVQHVDRILVLDNGYIVETGTHEDLIQKDGLYYRLAALQFKEAVI